MSRKRLDEAIGKKALGKRKKTPAAPGERIEKKM
jgi:hypothetical protein